VLRPALIIAAASVLLAGCGSGDESTTTRPGDGTSIPGPATTAAGSPPTTRPAPPAGTVEIVDFAFSPREITITRGEAVTWRNEDPYGHWVVSTDPDVLDSGELSQAQTFSETFSRTGTVEYYCNIHNYMKATVTVR
jgi:plastocyanin